MSAIKHFLDMVSVHKTENKNDRYYTAFCPVCGHDEQSTIESSEEIARTSAKGKILAHAKSKHKDLELEKE
jgi:hypothetical protein